MDVWIQNMKCTRIDKADKNKQKDGWMSIARLGQNQAAYTQFANLPLVEQRNHAWNHQGKSPKLVHS